MLTMTAIAGGLNLTRNPRVELARCRTNSYSLPMCERVMVTGGLLETISNSEQPGWWD